jgi:leucine dehydrogenase
MTAFEQMTRYGFGEVFFKRDAKANLCAIIAVHNTQRGPALGGCRFATYESEELALIDALRLARGMTYKAAIARLPQGGGKSVIVRPQGGFDRTALFESFGRFVDGLGGRYITAADSGTSEHDMDTIRTATRHVTGMSKAKGGAGDPSPWTALGVRRGIEAAVHFVTGRNSLQDVHVAIQGVGQVGYYLGKELTQLGARLTVADIDESKAARAASEFGAKVVSIGEISEVACDVFAPCALGSSINAHTLPKLRCNIVAGGANNQLAEPHHGEELMRHNIFYAPDYAINAGGLIHVTHEAHGYDENKVREQTLRIYDTIIEIAERSKSSGLPPHQIADAMAEERIENPSL